jgi:hypothetical protein
MATLVLLPGLHGTEHFYAPLRAQLPAELRVRTITYPTRRVASPSRLLAQIDAELGGNCVDLVCTDPPFNSNRNSVVLCGETKKKRFVEDPDRLTV